MSDLPKRVQIQEEGPREGFQFEKGQIPTARKIELIDALSQTGIDHIQIVSFVNPQGRARAWRTPRRWCAASRASRASPTRRSGSTTRASSARSRSAALTSKGYRSWRRRRQFLKRNQNRTPERAARRSSTRSSTMYKAARHPGRARRHHGGVRLQFRRRHSGRARGRAGAAASSISRPSTVTLEVHSACRHDGVGDAACRSSACSARCATKFPDVRIRAASARHARHGHRQRLWRAWKWA